MTFNVIICFVANRKTRKKLNVFANAEKNEKKRTISIAIDNVFKFD